MIGQSLAHSGVPCRLRGVLHSVLVVSLATPLITVPSGADEEGAPGTEAGTVPGDVVPAAPAAPAAPADSSDGQKSTLVPLPFYIHSPETKSGGGVAFQYIHRSENSAPDSKPSTYTGVFLYTQRSQLVIAAGLDRYWSSECNQLEAGVTFARFPNTFYGLGNHTDADVSEDFTPRTVSVEFGLRKQIAPDVRFGPHAEYRHEEILELEAGGALDRGAIPGFDGGTVVLAGVSAVRDKRDRIIYPRGGSYAELSFEGAHDAFGSAFDFATWKADLRWYRSLSSGQILAVRGLATVQAGTPPFPLLTTLGGDRVMRGFYEGRFRDRARYVFQSEYRAGFWKRLGVVVFADLGDVADRVTTFRARDVRASGGIGARFLLSRAEEVTLRADLARGDDGTGGLYLSMLEAF